MRDGVCPHFGACVAAYALEATDQQERHSKRRLYLLAVGCNKGNQLER